MGLFKRRVPNYEWNLLRNEIRIMDSLLVLMNIMLENNLLQTGPIKDTVQEMHKKYLDMDSRFPKDDATAKELMKFTHEYRAYIREFVAAFDLVNKG